jgi:TPP-dependent 2-oxoacid decarboxylase
MSERAKMIHVVGQTTRTMQKNKLMIHHSIGDKPDHQVSLITTPRILRIHRLTAI